MTFLRPFLIHSHPQNNEFSAITSRVYLNCSDEMAQLHVLNGTEKLGEMEKVEELAKLKDNYLFSKNVRERGES